mmetsp:Transcript_6067/g.12671  ORF Transcript_6067/g.12671 Transcript_6067/m.12671 type:complete len:333 (-) Transcript_6067:121-1119(-)
MHAMRSFFLINSSIPFQGGSIPPVLLAVYPARFHHLLQHTGILSPQLFGRLQSSKVRLQLLLCHPPRQNPRLKALRKDAPQGQRIRLVSRRPGNGEELFIAKDTAVGQSLLDDDVHASRPRLFQSLPRSLLQHVVGALHRIEQTNGLFPLSPSNGDFHRLPQDLVLVGTRNAQTDRPAALPSAFGQRLVNARVREDPGLKGGRVDLVQIHVLSEVLGRLLHLLEEVLHRVILHLVRVALPELDPPVGDVGVPPLGAHVHGVRRDALAPEELPHELLAEAVRPGAVEPRSDRPLRVHDGLHDRVGPRLHGLHIADVLGSECGGAVEVDVTRTA